MQDVETNGSGVWQKTTDYALGARGMDGISVTQNGATNVGYPIYDAHSNRVASLTKHYAGQYVTNWDLSDVRTYDACGNITNTSGHPRVRYYETTRGKLGDNIGGQGILGSLGVPQ